MIPAGLESAFAFNTAAVFVLLEETLAVLAEIFPPRLPLQLHKVSRSDVLLDEAAPTMGP
jgi:hypothetical protein